MGARRAGVCPDRALDYPSAVFTSVDETSERARRGRLPARRARSRPRCSSPTGSRSRSSSRAPPASGRPSSRSAFAAAAGRTLIRLQCYEGLDEAKALYEWEYAKQLLYTQLLTGRIGETVRGGEEPRRGGRRHRRGGQRLLLRALPPAAPDPARHHERDAGAAPRRRDRQGRPRVRGVPARGALGLRGDRPGARHVPRAPRARAWCSPRTPRASSPTR